MVLSNLKTKGIIISVGSRRLIDMGFVAGKEVEFVRSPFKDPIEVKIGSTHFVLRRNLSDLVVVMTGEECEP